MINIEETQKTLFLLAHELHAMGNKLQSTENSDDVPQRMRNMSSDLLLLRTKIVTSGAPTVNTVDINQTPVNLAPMSLFPTMGSLQQVIDLANSQLPITTPNALFGLLMTYHNTLLYQVACCQAGN
jgi:hypothetical protein